MAIASINLPDSWKFYLASFGAMIVLAGLDIVGALFAKEWAERGRFPMFLLGWGAFTVLFVVYARSLKFAELSTVTIGWVVLLQVGLLVVDSVFYDVTIPRSKWVAIAIILILQFYLVLSPHDGGDAQAKPENSATSREVATKDGGTNATIEERALEQRATKPIPRRPLGPISMSGD